MKRLHCLDIFLTSLAGLVVRIVQLLLREELGCRVSVRTSAARANGFDELGVDLATADRFHHREMFQIVVRLEESVAGKELYQDATYAPYIARKRPTKVEDDLRSTVVSSRDDRRVVFVVECRRAEVYEANLTV